jgi:hypothetical protein
MTDNLVPESRRTSIAILVGAGLFIFALTVSAVFVPALRLLHVFQALIYVAVIVLTRRHSGWGFGIGVFIATAWNGLQFFVTHLIQAGAERTVVTYAHRHAEPAGYADGRSWWRRALCAHRRVLG